MGIYETYPINDKFYGFRIYKLNHNSPLKSQGIKELEDFLIPPNEVFDMKIPFYEWIKLNIGKEVTLEVYNLRKKHMKNITFKINKEGGIGAVVRYENWMNARRNVFHVLKVKEQSMAEKQLKLVPLEDYLIGIRPMEKDIISFNKEDEIPFTILERTIKENLGEHCEFYIYNQKLGAQIRQGTIDNNEHFEFGCDVAYGKIHEFPYEEQDEELHNDDSASEHSVDEKKQIKIIDEGK